MRMSPPSFSVISSSMVRALPSETKLLVAVIVVPSTYIGVKALLSMLILICCWASPALMATCCDRY